MSDKERIFYLEDELERQKHLRLEWARRIEENIALVERIYDYAGAGTQAEENYKRLSLRALAEEMKK